MKCSGCGKPIESFYSAPTEDGSAGHYCSQACVAEAVKKWVGFSCHVSFFKPERGGSGLHHVATVSELRHLLQPYANHERLVIYVDRDLGESGSVWVHVAGDRAWVTHMTPPGGEDTYCHSDTETAAGERIGFWLSNGQEDLIHRSWTVPRPDGIRALEYFLQYGERDPSLKWAVPRRSFMESEPV